MTVICKPFSVCLAVSLELDNDCLKTGFLPAGDLGNYNQEWLHRRRGVALSISPVGPHKCLQLVAECEKFSAAPGQLFISPSRNEVIVVVLLNYDWAIIWPAYHLFEFVIDCGMGKVFFKKYGRPNLPRLELNFKKWVTQLINIL